MTRLVIVGGSDAGISAGLRAQQVDPSAEPLLIVGDAFPNFSICAIPYHVFGDVADWRDLAHRTRDDLEAAGLELRLDTTARVADPTARTVLVTGATGAAELVAYDQIVIGTGAVPVRPPITGLDQLGPDTFALTEALDREPRSAVIVGAALAVPG
jgi:NADPH-dependent 2,4-dienoyl-CoA reductase/sulfur reductase-like enzyme